MKRKIVSLMLGMAVCAGVAAMADLARVSAADESCLSNHHCVCTETKNEYSNFNDLWHDHWGYEKYYCVNCDADFYVNQFDYREAHDMEWVDYDIGLLRCVCGHEEYFH